MDTDPQNQFPEKAETLVHSLSEIYRHQNNNAMCEILDNSSPRIELTYYDNWNGGTEYYTLFLELPLKLFASIEANITKFETLIGSKLPRLLGDIENRVLRRISWVRASAVPS
jgi:hypothetical protein